MTPSIRMRLKKRTKTLAFQIISFTFIYLVIIYFVSTLATQHLVSGVMLDNAREAIGNLAREKAQTIDKDLSTMDVLGWSLHELYVNDALTEVDLNSYITHILRHYPELISVCIALNPDQKAESKIFMVNEGRLSTTVITNNDFQFADWYQIPYLTQKAYWTDPWYDKDGSRLLVCSYSLPIVDNNEIKGIIRMDIPMKKLQNTVLPIKVRKTGYAFLLSYNGTIVAHPTDSLSMNYTIFDIAELFDNKQLHTIGRDLVKDKTNFVKLKEYVGAKNIWMYYTPLRTNHWVLAIVVPDSEVFSDLNSLLIIFIVSSILSFLTISGVIYWRTHAINEPLEELVDSIKRVGTGDLDSELKSPPTKTYEIEVLADAYAKMKDSLKEYIENLHIVTEEKNRIINEIMFASAIQRNLIPQNYDQSKLMHGITAYGVLQPAGDVGGDLYDYFQIDKDHFCIGVADVVGKGIGAAMTMTMVSTLLRTIAGTLIKPDLILGELNKFLYKNNLESNFVTIIIGVIDLRTGELTFSNAGHVPLYLLSDDHQLTVFSDTHSTALGFFENISIESQTIKLRANDQIILITDGITEAMDAQEELFGSKGVQRVLVTIKDPYPEITAHTILANVEEYTDPSKHLDDISILVVQYTPEPM